MSTCPTNPQYQPLSRDTTNSCGINNDIKLQTNAETYAYIVKNPQITRSCDGGDGGDGGDGDNDDDTRNRRDRGEKPDSKAKKAKKKSKKKSKDDKEDLKRYDWWGFRTAMDAGEQLADPLPGFVKKKSKKTPKTP